MLLHEGTLSWLKQFSVSRRDTEQPLETGPGKEVSLPTLVQRHA
jgi:hypothetical protein